MHYRSFRVYSPGSTGSNCSRHDSMRRWRQRLSPPTADGHSDDSLVSTAQPHELSMRFAVEFVRMSSALPVECPASVGPHLIGNLGISRSFARRLWLFHFTSLTVDTVCHASLSSSASARSRWSVIRSVPPLLAPRAATVSPRSPVRPEIVRPASRPIASLSCSDFWLPSYAASCRQRLNRHSPVS